jgi:hypothetical protein
VSAYIIISAVAVGLSSLGSCAVGVVAVIRARREDLPAVVEALNRRARPMKRSRISLDRDLRTHGAQEHAMLAHAFWR